MAAAFAALSLVACAPAPTPSVTAVETTSATPTLPPMASATPTESTAPTPVPSASPTIALNIEVKVREHCGSIGGCAIYGSLIPAGESSTEEVRLDAKGRGLPTLIGAGAYVVRFRLVAVSDDRAAGVPPDETSITTCETPIDVSFQSAVNLKAVFRRDSCKVTGTYTVTIID